MAAVQLGELQFDSVHLLWDTTENSKSRKFRVYTLHSIQLENDKEIER